MSKNSKYKNRRSIEAILEELGILSQALPFIDHYNGLVVVVKFGGSAMLDDSLARAFAEDVVLLKRCGVHPVIVHGGGPQIGNFLDRLDIKTEFIDGLRVTDSATVEVVEMVLSGKINKSIVGAIQVAGGYAIGLSGRDCRLMEVRPVNYEVDGCVVDLGFVGEPYRLDTDFIETVIYSTDIIPVIAPLGFDGDGGVYNVNADTVAGALASALGAERLVLLTDVAGVLDKEGHLLSELSLSDCGSLRADGILHGGMIPKVETCVGAIRGGVGAAVIIDGRSEHALLLEMFTEGGHGTLIRE